VTTIKDGENPVGNRVRVRVVKNKVAPPFKKAEFDIMFDRGISYEGDLLDLAVENEIVSKQGSWFSYGDTRLGQGRENAKRFFEDNAEMCAEIREKILAVVMPAEEELPETPKATEPPKAPKA
jgi:recombination protein RecA